MTYKTIMTLLLFAVALVAIPSASAGLALDQITFDPAIIAAGDTVDIVIQYRDNAVPDDDSRIGDPDYTFRVRIAPDDELTRDYVTIEDAQGDNTHGSVLRGAYYSKRFRVRVDTDAPAGSYEFRLIGQWYKNGAPEGGEQSVRFQMPVKREGIILDVASLTTLPLEVRPGDNYVEIHTFLENVGEKDAKFVEVVLESPEGIEPSYSDNNRVWAGRVNSGEQKETVFSLDLDEDLKPGVHMIRYQLSYMDVDDNMYSKSIELPLRVKGRPYLEVVSSKGTAYAGSNGQLQVVIKNTGSESAESVDVRIIKQNAQPFSIDVRSDYIGELETGEEGTAIFEIDVSPDAAIKEHDLKLLIRSKGDSDEGDDTIYTYNRRAAFTVDGKAPNKLLWTGGIAGAIIVAVFAVYTMKKGGSKK